MSNFLYGEQLLVIGLPKGYDAPKFMSASQATRDQVWTFLPGLHGTDELYEKLRANLPAEQACEWVNLPAKGKQDYSYLSKWLDEELDNLEGTQRVLIAESFSGPLATRLASLRPEEVSAVVLASSFCDAPLNPGIALLPLRPLFMVKPPRKALQHFLIGEESNDDEVQELRKIMRSISSSTLSRRVRAILELETEDSPQLKGLPMLILQAKDDNLIPWEAQQRLEARYPEARVHWIDSPHMILQKHPAVCIENIIDFVENFS
ncbi:MAG: alpha/beta fold hydrolase [Akkermansiaceae bacterium]